MPKAEFRAKTGRKESFVVTPEILEKVRQMASRQLNQGEIIDVLGINEQAWYRRCLSHPELKKAYLQGKSQMKSYVAGKLIRAIDEGDIAATIFFLKTKGGWVSADKELEQEKEPEVKPDLVINVTDPIDASKIYQEIMRGKDS